MINWRVYSRPGCGLCNEFMTELAMLLGAAAEHVEVIDIDGDPTLKRKYSDRIPVLTADGDFVCSYRLDPERIRRYLAP